MNARSVILSRPIEDPSPQPVEGGLRGRGEARVLTQRAQRAIQKISALLSATRAA
jgi:hypothetical protein